MEYKQKEALRYLKAEPGDSQAEILVDTVYLKMRNEVQARHTLKRLACQVDVEGVTLDGGVRFHSRQLAAHLRDCTELILLGATLGSRVDSCIRRLGLLSVAEGAAAQAVGAALIESYLDELQKKLEPALLEDGLKQKWRFSPGYGDWPLEEQKQVFAVLDCAKTIGLTLTNGLMMVPSKSVTAVIGLTCKEVKPMGAKCRLCSKIDCEFRVVEEK